MTPHCLTTVSPQIWLHGCPSPSDRDEVNILGGSQSRMPLLTLRSARLRIMVDISHGSGVGDALYMEHI
jgi:hypothetical protein